jgi:hypothetical protein
MEIFRSIMSGLIGGFLTLFEGRNAMWSLAPISLLLGIAMLWVFRVTSNQAAIRQAKRRLQAHLYELRLFADEPALIWRAQRGLLAANARYIGLMLIPAVVLTVPMVVLFVHLESFYGMGPLPAGEPAIVTLQMKAPLDPQVPPPALEAPEGIAVETPGVRVPGERQVSWRLRPLHAASGYLRVILPGQTVEKKIEAGAGPRYLSDRRVSTALDLLWHPAEKRLPAGPVEWIEVRYPPATVHWLGLDLHWLIWLLVLSMASALLLKKRFRVSF